MWKCSKCDSENEDTISSCSVCDELRAKTAPSVSAVPILELTYDPVVPTFAPSNTLKETPILPKPASEKKKHTFRNVLIVAAVLMVVIIMWPNKEEQTTTASLSVPVQEAPAYGYVISDGLNVRSGPSTKYSVVMVLYKNNCAQLIEGSGSISGPWRKIKYDNYEGWVDSSYLQIIKVTNLRVGNWNNGNWITQAGETLYADDIRYLKPVITYDASINRGFTFYVKIIDPDGYIKRNTNTSPAGYSYSTTGNIKSGAGNSFTLNGWGRDERGTYSAGVYTIEVWYEGVCLRSEKVRLN
jgi:uncharacterized protein YraI